ncbi:MAG: glycosyltransferase family 4 protein [Nitrospirae bacterium]|nr:glycosyltransferase family 4 protein [Nitrospirota bacterium]
MDIALIRKNYTQYGGAETYLGLVAGGLSARGHRVRIFSAGTWPRTFEVTRVGTVGKPSLLSNLLFALNCRRRLSRGAFGCILSFERTLFQDIYRAGDGCHKEWLRRRRISEPLLKGASFAFDPHHRLILLLEKKCLTNSGIIIANSAMVRDDIIRHYGIDPGKMRVIYNGVDLERFRPSDRPRRMEIRKSLNIGTEKVILFAGADFRRKGVPTLLRAFALMKEPDVRLIIAGRQPGPEFVSMAEGLGISGKVIFRGAEKRMEELYAAADVFVLPTIYDPFSNAALEAMASGLPVVTTSSNGASELIENGVQGFKIDDPVDAPDFAEKISVALRRSGEMGRQARTRAEGHPLEKAVDEIIEVINALDKT